MNICDKTDCHRLPHNAPGSVRFRHTLALLLNDFAPVCATNHKLYISKIVRHKNQLRRTQLGV